VPWKKIDNVLGLPTKDFIDLNGFSVPVFNQILSDVLEAIDQGTISDFSTEPCAVPILNIDDVLAFRVGNPANPTYFIVRINSVERRREPILRYEYLVIEYFSYTEPTFILRNNN